MNAFKRLAPAFTAVKSMVGRMPAVWEQLRPVVNPWAVLRAERRAAAECMPLASEIVALSEGALSDYRLAAGDLANLFDDGMLASHVAERFTCDEIEGIAAFFRAVDYPTVADLWLECHAEGDDEDDLHYQGERSEPVELVLAS
ncbi:hypothetical protein AB0K71_15650 [Streptomyces syringium]|uniref:hypothetical protein n=1 Tax=Streptomyces syringium TaxID=76729 RepID=UPI00341B186A